MQELFKYNLPRVSADLYNESPQRYEIRPGNTPGAPKCPFGHYFKWLSYDLLEEKYVRLSKSIFKKLIAEYSNGKAA